MPRHTHDSGPLHAYLPPGERAPRFVTPPPEWIIDNYRVPKWYYRHAPEIGDRVRYLEDEQRTIVVNVTRTHVVLENSLTMRRPLDWGKLYAWLLPRLKPRSGLSTARPRRVTHSSPNGVTLYV